MANAPVGDYTDLDHLLEFSRGLDVLTFDHEHVPTEHLRSLQRAGVNVHPGPDALVNAQDKLVMRAAIDRLELPNPRWAAVDDVAGLVAFGEDIGWPVVLKTPRGGYDGKGVRIVDSAAEAADTAEWFAAMSPLLAEAKVDFSRELSALVARTPDGESRAWPVVHTIQVDGVCDEVIAPALDIPLEVAAAAESAALRIASELGVTGVMAVELFETPGVGAGFLINELAMRPHNTGHWTQDGSVTSQFEQHLRAVLNLPLGATDLLGPVVVMKNFLGGENQNLFSAYPRSPRERTSREGPLLRQGRPTGPQDRPRQPRRRLGGRRRLGARTRHHGRQHHPERQGAVPHRSGSTRGERMSSGSGSSTRHSPRTSRSRQPRRPGPKPRSSGSSWARTPTGP